MYVMFDWRSYDRWRIAEPPQSGYVIVTRFPALHPGDVHCLQPSPASEPLPPSAA